MIQLLNAISKAPFCRGTMVIYLIFLVLFVIVMIKESKFNEYVIVVCIAIGIAMIIIVILLKGSGW